MKANELMVGDWVMPLQKRFRGIPGQVVTIDGGTDTCWIDCDDYSSLIRCGDVEEIPLTPEILEKNGWVETSGYWVLKGYSTRLGWKGGEMIIGYSALPEKVLYVHELQNLMKAVKISCNFEI